MSFPRVKYRPSVSGVKVEERLRCSGIDEALIAALASSVGGAAASKLLAPKGGVAIPPPPGAAIVNPQGQAAAAQLRRRQAVAGGLNSTITGAGFDPATPAAAGSGSATAGAKPLLGT